MWIEMTPEEYRDFFSSYKSYAPSLYPVTIVTARYGGVYENAQFIAVLCHPDEMPEDITGDDIQCCYFFRDYSDIVGLGGTPDSALADLTAKYQGVVAKNG